MSLWLKVCDLLPQSRRGRPPVLVGFVGPYRLLVVERHQAGMGEPRATLFIAKREVDNGRKLKSACGEAEAERRLRELAITSKWNVRDDPAQ
jgi:hypothetical protein